MPAREAAAHFVISSSLALALGFGGRSLLIGANSGLTFGGCQRIHQRMLRRKYHEAHSIQGVGTGGEYLDGQLRMLCYSELHRCTFAPSNPIALSLFDAVRPLQGFEVVQQPL